jgi:hypothetical protein
VTVTVTDPSALVWDFLLTTTLAESGVEDVSAVVVWPALAVVPTAMLLIDMMKNPSLWFGLVFVLMPRLSLHSTPLQTEAQRISARLYFKLSFEINLLLAACRPARALLFASF